MSARSRFLEPPRLRTLAGGEQDDRRATWLELFFDLVFVAAVGQLANALSARPTPTRFFEFLGLFVPVWWAWSGYTFYANRFDTDDLPYRLLTLLGMFGVAVLATTVPGVFKGATLGFPLAYVGVRSVLLVLYERARRHVPEARALARTFLLAFGSANVLWLVSLAPPRPWNYVLWSCALLVELSAPILAWRQIPRAPIHPRHIPERFGLLTLIVLGESVFAVVFGVSRVSWELSSAAAAVAGFLVAAALWWIYFGFLDEAAVTRRGIFGGLVYVYMHYFVIVGLTALGAGVKMAILAAGGDSHYDGTAWVLCAGLAMTMLGLAVIELVSRPRAVDTDFWLRVATLVLALALVPLDRAPLSILLVLAGVLVAQVVFELARHEVHAHEAEI
ncbi:MAG: low temperature requirement protein A [Actinobacteria bacterium]|nr:MAG: low temperature requirement protein A [Actinomycetota bacterium]